MFLDSRPILEPRRHSSVVEQLFRKQQVLGSNPSVGSTIPERNFFTHPRALGPWVAESEGRYVARTRRRRANREGSLYQTKSGLWRGAVTYTNPETGATKRSFVAHRSQSVARERLTAMRRQLDLGSIPLDGSLTRRGLPRQVA